jgi:hypothetical protein
MKFIKVLQQGRKRRTEAVEQLAVPFFNSELCPILPKGLKNVAGREIQDL